MRLAALKSNKTILHERKRVKGMTIKAIKETYKNYQTRGSERNSFVTYDYNDGNGKVVIIVNNHSAYRKTVMQAVRVSDGKELIPTDDCRPCDNLDDAIDVAGEMMVF